jgi:hypothetical protein
MNICFYVIENVFFKTTQNQIFIKLFFSYIIFVNEHMLKNIKDIRKNSVLLKSF